MPDRILCISVKPEWADKIFAAEERCRKTLELRKSFPKVEVGSWVLVYATAPVKAFIGLFQLDGLMRLTGDQLVDDMEVFKRSMVSLAHLQAYYAGREWGCGLEVGELLTFPVPVPLDESLARLNLTSPGYRYLDRYVFTANFLWKVERLMNLKVFGTGDE